MTDSEYELLLFDRIEVIKLANQRIKDIIYNVWLPKVKRMRFA